MSPIVSRVSLNARDASSSISRSASAVRAGSRSTSRRPARACSAMPASAWPTTSCRSRAIRTRSWATASRASTSRSASSSRLRSCSVRRTSPMIVARTRDHERGEQLHARAGLAVQRQLGGDQDDDGERHAGDDRAAAVGQVRDRGGREHRAQPAGRDRVAERGRQQDPRDGQQQHGERRAAAEGDRRRREDGRSRRRGRSASRSTPVPSAGLVTRTESTPKAVTTAASSRSPRVGRIQLMPRA